MARAPRAASRRARARAAPVAVPADAQLLPRRARARAHRRGRARPGPARPARRAGRRRSSAARRCGRCSTTSRGCPSCSGTRCCGASSTASRTTSWRASSGSPAARRAASCTGRARALTRAAEGRTIGCTDVRPDIFDAYDRRRRPTARTLRHLASCPACRSLQAALRAQRRRLAVLAPPAGLLALLGAGALKPLLLGGHAKATTVASTLVVAAGVSVELFEAGQPAPMGAVVDRAARQRPRRRLADPARHGDRAPRGRRSRSSARSRSAAPTGCASRTCCRRDGGRVSAHYAGTTIGADQAGRVVLTGRRAASGRVTVAALCRRPDAQGSIVDASRAALAARGRHRAHGERAARGARLVRAARERPHGRAGGRRASRARLGTGPDRHGDEGLAARARAARRPVPRFALDGGDRAEDLVTSTGSRTRGSRRPGRCRVMSGRRSLSCSSSRSDSAYRRAPRRRAASRRPEPSTRRPRSRSTSARRTGACVT